MRLRIDRTAAKPIYLQIAASLREQIASGLLPEGQRLPPERDLARTLGVNRSTILAAYGELKADGLVEAHVGRGTVVLPQHFTGSAVGAAVPAFSWRQITRRSLASEPLPIIRDLLDLASRKDVVPLSIGLPAPDLLPLAAVGEIQRRLLVDRGAQMLLHSPTEGIAPLRESIAALMSRRGIECDPGEILITSGSQQGLDLVRRVLLDPGDVVVVEQPTFFGALELLRNADARVVPVPVDQDGMRVDVLEEILGRLRPKLIYTLPTFQNPSGMSLCLERRRKLLDLAHRFQVPIVEDDLYYDLRYDGAPLPPLRALDPAGYVLYLSSVSKVLFPGLRIGWLVAPRAFVRSLALAKQATDLHSNTFGQWLVDAFLRDGLYQPHAQAMQKAYAAKRRAMLEALERHASRGLSWRKPAGGFYLWCQYPSQVSPDRLLARAAQERVSFLPGEACMAAEQGRNHLRLNFTFPTTRQIGQGIERLARALAVVSEERAPRRAVGSETRPIT